MKQPLKRYRVSMTVDESDSKLILYLLGAGATDLKVVEVTELNLSVRRKNAVPRYPRGVIGHQSGNGTEDWKAKWADRYWLRFKAVLQASPDQTAGYLDKRFIQIVKKEGKKESMVSPLWTIFMRQGRVDRVGRGVYKLAEKSDEAASV